MSRMNSSDYRTSSWTLYWSCASNTCMIGEHALEIRERYAIKNIGCGYFLVPRYDSTIQASEHGSGYGPAALLHM